MKSKKQTLPEWVSGKLKSDLLRMTLRNGIQNITDILVKNDAQQKVNKMQPATRAQYAALETFLKNLAT